MIMMGSQMMKTMMMTMMEFLMKWRLQRRFRQRGLPETEGRGRVHVDGARVELLEPGGLGRLATAAGHPRERGSLACLEKLGVPDGRRERRAEGAAHAQLHGEIFRVRRRRQRRFSSGFSVHSRQSEGQHDASTAAE